MNARQRYLLCAAAAPLIRGPGPVQRPDRDEEVALAHPMWESESSASD
jgi:hypothetical protein